MDHMVDVLHMRPYSELEPGNHEQHVQLLRMSTAAQKINHQSEPTSEHLDLLQQQVNLENRIQLFLTAPEAARARKHKLS
jgi:hypothetical protein